MVNNQMGSQQLRHHITNAQAIHLEGVFGDISVLLDLAGMEDKTLDNIIRCDGEAQGFPDCEHAELVTHDAEQQHTPRGVLSMPTRCSKTGYGRACIAHALILFSCHQTGVFHL